MSIDPKFFDEFCDAFAHSGSILIKCGCGITHVATDELSWLEEEEILEINDLRVNNPEILIEWNCSSISWTTINGRDVVFGCPCGYAEKLCFFIENHHPEIMKLIEKIVKFEKSEIEAKEKMLRNVQDVK